MALPDWIRGMLLRPADTYAQAQTEMRYAYLWILLSVFTVESVMLLYHPSTRSAVPSVPAGALLLILLHLLLTLFAVQAVLLFWSARLFGWKIQLQEAAKYTGLIWTLFLVEDIVTFVPYLRQRDWLVLWASVPFLVWRVAAQTAGVRRLSGLSWGRALGLVLIATLPWNLPLLYLNWSSLVMAQ
ncbi:MAG: hypothetical protein DIU55_002855 [Bacillota bacterium]|nr:MAG: hypothetical protein DIU55_00480 [Bacillota bacterium]